MNTINVAQFLQDSAGIKDPRAAGTLAAHATVRALAKGEALLQAGEHQAEIAVLIDGAVRTALIDSAGRDTTDCLITKRGMVIAPCADFSRPSPVRIEAIIPSHVASIPIEAVQSLLGTSLPFAHDFIAILQNAWQMHWDIKTAVCQKTARERYLWFLDAYPGVIDLIPHHYIASYLGMTQVTLSRVRKEVPEA